MRRILAKKGKIGSLRSRTAAAETLAIWAECERVVVVLKEPLVRRRSGHGFDPRPEIPQVALGKLVSDQRFGGIPVHKPWIRLHVPRRRSQESSWE